MSDLIRVSASKLKTFSSCARQYHYKYIDGLEQKKHPAAVLGSSVHATIDTVYKKGVDPGSFFIQDYYTRSMESEVPIDARMQRDGMEMVTSYDYKKRTPVETEIEFLLPFPNQAHPICIVHGFIDQLYPWGFVDLKTNKRKPLRGVLNHDIQFILYTWAFKELVGYEPEQTIWHHLRTSEDLVSTATDVDLATRVIEQLLDTRMTGVYDRRVGEACLFCSYRSECLGTNE